MTHHKRRATTPRPKPHSNPFIAAIEAARDRIIRQMENPRAPIWWMTQREYDAYTALIGRKPDPSFRIMGKDTDA